MCFGPKIKNAPVKERRPRDAISRDVNFYIYKLGKTRFFVKKNLILRIKGQIVIG